MLWSNPQKGPLTQCYLAPKDKARSSLSSFHVPLHSNIPMCLLFVLLSLHDYLTSSLLNCSSFNCLLARPLFLLNLFKIECSNARRRAQRHCKRTTKRPQGVMYHHSHMWTMINKSILLIFETLQCGQVVLKLHNSSVCVRTNVIIQELKKC